MSTSGGASTTVIKSIYNRRVRPHLPSKVVYYNTVAVQDPDVALFDQFSGDPSRKAALANYIREHVDSDDQVVEIGAGKGVMTTIAARQGAQVSTFEGSVEQLRVVEDTLERNGVQDRVKTYRGVVGKPCDIWGEAAENHLLPSELPSADVLILDCEGSELSIIEGLSELPDRMLVEPHPFVAEVTVNDVINVLETRGYSIKAIDGEGYRDGKAVINAQFR